MAKFKKGDRVRCVKVDSGRGKMFGIGETVVVSSCKELTFYDDLGGFFWTSHWELATPSPIPDTVTIGGVEYVRKPEPDHVWAWGQWARVDEGCREGEKVFVTGPVKDNGYVPVTYKDCDGINHTNGFYPQKLTYLGTATIPE